MMTWLKDLQLALEPYPWAYSALVVVALIVMTLAVNFITKWILFRGMRRVLDALPPAGSEEHRVFLAIISRLANIIPAVVLAAGASTIPGIHEIPATLIRNLSAAFIVLAFSLALGKTLDLVDLLYSRRPDAADRPIKGYLQLMKICIWTGAVFLMIAMLINRSPLLLFSGLGAMAAVLILIFQDTILSVVAAMQISSNDMVRIGDWIEMPSQNADGSVIVQIRGEFLLDFSPFGIQEKTDFGISDFFPRFPVLCAVCAHLSARGPADEEGIAVPCPRNDFLSGGKIDLDAPRHIFRRGFPDGEFSAGVAVRSFELRNPERHVSGRILHARNLRFCETPLMQKFIPGQNKRNARQKNAEQKTVCRNGLF